MPSKDSDIIRTKGIIVEDSLGRARILIESPIPYTVERVRTDSVRIKETWGKRMPDRYLDLYKGYNHSVSGIVILDNEGWDKIAIGDPVPDPIFGKRIGPETGIVMNGDIGLERTGYGLIKVDDKLRVVLGLDNENGTEGAALSLMPDGSVGLYLDSNQRSIFLGRVTPGHWKSPDGNDFSGLIIQDTTGTKKIIE